MPERHLRSDGLPAMSTESIRRSNPIGKAAVRIQEARRPLLLLLCTVVQPVRPLVPGNRFSEDLDLL